jgi:hypothetical protein
MRRRVTGVQYPARGGLAHYWRALRVGWDVNCELTRREAVARVLEMAESDAARGIVPDGNTEATGYGGW